jgi:hypothetical protein
MASLRPSPTILKEDTTIIMVIPGVKKSIGSVNKNLGNDFRETLTEVCPILFNPSLISIQKI